MRKSEGSGKHAAAGPKSQGESHSSSVTEKGRRLPVLLLLGFIALATAIIAVEYSSLRRYIRNSEIEVALELTSIAELKVSQIDRWRKERLRDAFRLKQNPMLPGLVRRFPRDPEAHKNLRTFLEKYKAGSEYDQIHVLDRQGKAGLSLPEGIPPVSPAVVRRLRDLFQSGSPEILDFYKDDAESRAFLSLLIPIADESPQPTVIGVIALRIDPEIFLYPYIQQWPRPSQTAETLIVRREGEDVLFLNELRFQKNSALNLRIPLGKKILASQAVGGREGIVKGLDYRRIPVIGSLRRIPDSPWFLIARMDRSEVNAPVRTRFWMNFGMAASLLFAAGLGLKAIQRRREIRILDERLDAERRLRALSSRQEALLSALPEIIMEVDRNKVYVWANGPGLDFFGEDVIGKEAAFYFEGEQNTYEKVAPVFAGFEDVIYVESWQRRRDGRKRLLGWWCRVLKDSAGNSTGALSSARDITEERQAETALRQNEAKFRSIFESIQDVYYEARLDGTILEMSPSIQPLSDGQYSREDLLGKSILAFYSNPEERPFFLKNLMEKGRLTDYEISLRNRDGNLIPCSLAAKIFSDAGGRPEKIVGSIRNITERKKAEDQKEAALDALRTSLREKELLLQEIHHRVKNNMQIISSLFNLEAVHASPETREILKKGQTRILSLSLVHERLYRSADLSRINLSEYIQDLAVHLFQVYLVDSSQVRLETDLEEVSLDINSAIPFGLILNELIANALKHAFPDGRKGVVRIRLARAPGDSVEFQVFDDGVGLPEGIDFQNPASFGFEIINLLVGQLEAEISLERKGGTTFTLKFKELKYKPRI